MERTRLGPNGEVTCKVFTLQQLVKTKIIALDNKLSIRNEKKKTTSSKIINDTVANGLDQYLFVIDGPTRHTISNKNDII